MQPNNLSVVMLGASGAVGTQTLQALLRNKYIQQITVIGRTPIPSFSAAHLQQYQINIFDSSSYEKYLNNHTTAICTLGVGQPSKMSKEEFIKIDKTAVLDFAIACKKAGVKHFELLASVGIHPTSASFYLRTKGELVEALKVLHFERLSIFQPSMILTPTNRYGISQAIVLKVWPLLKPLLAGSLRKYRGISVEQLGESIAKNISLNKTGEEFLHWDEFSALTAN
jgi:uncharacterized protein YbjT (DUF2867 family)